MLSYQHAFHAGNPADLHKHIVFAELLSLLTKKDRGITVMETHSGRGLYDLTSAEAQKTGEAADGVGRLSLDPDTPHGAAISTIRARHGETAYPGSPLIASHFLRPQDRQLLMELHPAEGPALKHNMKGTIAEIHQRDGYEGVLAIAPPTPRKGLVLIDPSYEVKTEYDQVADFVPKLTKKWPEASVLIWYPILTAGRHEGMIEALAPVAPTRHEVRFHYKEGKGMLGSGLILVNPPFGSEACFDAALAQAGSILKK